MRFTPTSCPPFSDGTMRKEHILNVIAMMKYHTVLCHLVFCVIIHFYEIKSI